MEHLPARGVRPGSDPNWCLSFHAGYRCRHSGACCTAGWPIPIEQDVHQLLSVHFRGQPERFDYEAPRPDSAAATAAIRASGDCAFVEPDRGRLCAIHRELGAERLPDACRQFPRVVLHDPRGTLISLSHFCPTAAALLAVPGPFRVVAADPSLALDGGAEGLDARGVLPPLLRRGMLTDSDGYAAWEARAIATLDRDDVDADAALARLETATRRLAEWRPGGAPLSEAVTSAFDIASDGESHEDRPASAAVDRRRVRLALDSIPPAAAMTCSTAQLADTAAALPAWWNGFDRPVRAYLAARLFGNWMAYHGPGLLAVVEYLRVALALVKADAARPRAGATSSPWQIVTEAVRNADLVLVHLCDLKLLARRLE